MKASMTPKPHTTQVAAPFANDPQLDERLWQAWKLRNERRDKVRTARFVKLAAILVVLGALAALVRRPSG